MNIQFEKIWNKVIKPLEGKILHTLKYNEPNTILKVTEDSLTRNSKNDSNPQTISKKEFELIYNHIMDNGSVSRSLINTVLPKRFSSIVCAVLSKAPNIKFDLNPIVLYKK
ncbi:hypothetical protein [Sphingobacterium sp. SGL-16]|uniref:hypothetical protein n=1 Tax=Sphingobacterium sp. SGL-16 TaxID=2710883 RepID=UPI0013E9BAC1|nr:hypothetical protein [Sphingobacterium sp. SGL-16]NGM71672.1 hypothetical protein [Sphingobacterium sp. SGL-16]